MELYERTAYTLSRQLTSAYSTSFGKSVKLLPKSMRHHIAAIYGLVRIADEIVDTYTGKDQRKLLDSLEKEVYESMERHYSTNPIVHSFTLTAQKYEIGKDLIEPFFESMRMDLSPRLYDKKSYAQYIEGSAEVVGLMCLKIFTANNKEYSRLQKGARHLGAAYQKINFLRDLRADKEQLGRWYFPYGSYESFNDDLKYRIIDDIDLDIRKALTAARQLPKPVQPAIMLSISYYQSLLDKLRRTPAQTLKSRRLRINNFRKFILLIRLKLRYGI